MKKLLKALLILVLVLLFAIASLLGWLSATEYRPEAVEPLPVSGNTEASVPSSGLRILSWNIGYAGLGEAEDFFMDGGKKAKPDSPEVVTSYLTGIAENVEAAAADLVLLQEVDKNSTRTYSLDETQFLKHTVSVHALNYSCPFVPVPVPPIGKVHSGLFTTTDFVIDRAERLSLPCPFSWPLRIANLKRCLLVSYLPVKNSEHELVLVNLHLEAYDSGEGKIAQTRQLMEFLNAEYEKGNFVIAGGDFNQIFPGGLDAYSNLHPELWSPGILEESSLPSGFRYAFDLDIPTCRLLNQPYDPSDSKNTQYYVIDGFIVSPNVTINTVETLDLGFRFSDHNPVLLSVNLEETA